MGTPRLLSGTFSARTQCDNLLSNFAFNFNLRHYTEAEELNYDDYEGPEDNNSTNSTDTEDELTFDERIKATFSCQGELRATIDLSSAEMLGLPPVGGWNTIRMPFFLTENMWYMPITSKMAVDGILDLSLGDQERPYARIASTLHAQTPCGAGEYATGNGTLYADLGIVRVEVPFAEVRVRCDMHSLTERESVVVASKWVETIFKAGCSLACMTSPRPWVSTFDLALAYSA